MKRTSRGNNHRLHITHKINISKDNHNRENVRITKSDSTIATETHNIQLQHQQHAPKPPLMPFVACKTVKENIRNQKETNNSI